jgi:hypothetical protein
VQHGQTSHHRSPQPGAGRPPGLVTLEFRSGPITRRSTENLRHTSSGCDAALGICLGHIQPDVPGRSRRRPDRRHGRCRVAQRLTVQPLLPCRPVRQAWMAPEVPVHFSLNALNSRA